MLKAEDINMVFLLHSSSKDIVTSFFGAIRFETAHASFSRFWRNSSSLLIIMIPPKGRDNTYYMYFYRTQLNYMLKLVTIIPVVSCLCNHFLYRILSNLSYGLRLNKIKVYCIQMDKD